MADKRHEYTLSADKIWDHLNNVDNITVARCTVERLMRDIGISGAKRGKSWVKTTITADGDERPADLVNRDFTAQAPNQLWLADITYVKNAFGVGVCRVHHRRVLPHDRGLASVAVTALRFGDRCVGDGW